MEPNKQRLVNLILMGIFFLLQVYVYGEINSWAHTVYGEHELALFPGERDIPLVSEFIVIYFPVFYALLGLSLLYFALVKYDLFAPVVLGLIFVELVCFPVFVFYPVVMDRPLPSEVPLNDVFDGMVRWYYELDEPYNLFPSLHAALSASLAYSWYRHNRKFGLYFVLPVAILVMVSTVFVRQHWIIDELVGALVGFAVSWVVFHASPTGKRFAGGQQ
ncbi:MAG: hypothetical protein Kow0069_16680 [Promethearchaeota archaeon]